jgi:hypothetical protein
MGQRRPTSLPSPGGTCHLISHSIRERIAEFRLFLMSEPLLWGGPLLLRGQDGRLLNCQLEVDGVGGGAGVRHRHTDSLHSSWRSRDGDRCFR